MKATAFDTLEYFNGLKISGMDDAQAHAITKETAKAIDQMIDSKELSTKKDLKESEYLVKAYLKDLEMKLKKFIVTTVITATAVLSAIPVLIPHFQYRSAPHVVRHRVKQSNPEVSSYQESTSSIRSAPDPTDLRIYTR